MALSNAQYQTIQRYYEELQLHNRHQMQSRKEEISQTLPEFFLLEKQISTLIVETTKSKLCNAAASYSDISKELASLRNEKIKRLKDAGYPVDYLEPIYSCSQCHDTGYTENGNKCKCFHQAVIQLIYTQSNLPQTLNDENFSTLSYDFYTEKELPAIKKAVATCQAFIKNFDSSYENLLLYGSVGIGKTFLSNCIAKELMESSHTVIYFSAIRLFDMMAAFKFSPAEFTGESADFYETLFQSDLLIIDDLGTDTPNSFHASQFFYILNERHIRKKSTIISTNLTLEKLLEQYSDRSFSRISGHFLMLKLEGRDIRIQKKMLLNSSK